jgi:hypothetical protein
MAAFRELSDSVRSVTADRSSTMEDEDGHHGDGARATGADGT